MALPRDKAGAFDLGWECYHRDKGIDENPYIDEHGLPYPGYFASQAMAWEDGWLCAEEDKERSVNGTQRTTPGGGEEAA